MAYKRSSSDALVLVAIGYFFLRIEVLHGDFVGVGLLRPARDVEQVDEARVIERSCLPRELRSDLLVLLDLVRRSLGNQSV